MMGFYYLAVKDMTVLFQLGDNRKFNGRLYLNVNYCNVNSY